MLLPAVARAEGSAGDELAAEAAFDEGRALMLKGDFAAACPKLEASQRLSPALGTLLNLSECYAKAGRTASAWITYKAAASTAQKAGQREREQIARARVAELEPQLCRLVVKPDSPAAADGVHVTRDGAALDPGAFGVAIPMDPGPHAVVISGEGKITVERSISVPASQPKCPDTVLVFAKLADAPKPPADKLAAGADSRDDKVAQDKGSQDKRGREDSGWGTRKILGVTAVGLGLAAGGVGVAFALDAESKKNNANCPASGCTTTAGQTALHDAGTSADFATGLFIAGGVLVVTGVILWLTAPSPEHTSTSGFPYPPNLRTAISF